MKNILIVSLVFFYIFFPHKAFTYTWVQYLTHDIIYDIAFEGSFIWCATDSGVVRYNKLNNSSIRLTMKDGLAHDEVRSIAIDNGGVKWFGSRGVSRFDGVNWTYYHLTDDLNYIGPPISSIVVGDNNIMWFAGIEGVYTIDGVVWKRLPWGAWKIIKDQNGSIWAAGSSGVRNINSQGDLLNGFGTDYSYFSAAIDSSSVLWFGGDTYLLKYDRNKWETFDYYQMQQGLFFIVALAVDKNNILWVGDETNGLSSFDGKKFTLYKDPALNHDDEVFSIKIDDSGVIWTGGTEGLRSFYPDKPSAVNDQSVPASFSTLSNYPNPFNSSTALTFALPFSGSVSLSIYSLTGQRVRTLISGNQVAGSHSAVWDGRDDSGNPVSSGVYISRLQMGNKIAVGRMLLLK